MTGGSGTGMMWAVSQATWLRRVHVIGKLSLSDKGYSSGGYLADVVVDGDLDPGTQQQWFSRNAQFNEWSGGGWNSVFVGCTGAPVGQCPDHSTVLATPVIAEKPYITIQDDGTYSLIVPRVTFSKVGASPGVGGSTTGPVDTISFSNVYVASPRDTADTINAKLALGLHLILSPGLYKLSDSIYISHPNTVVLGLGYATIICGTGKPGLIVGDVDGVRIAGLLFQAGPRPTPTLLRVGGENSSYVGRASNPVFLYDISARSGGDSDPNLEQMQTDIMMQINSGNVVIDNAWLWRADHDIVGSVVDSMNPSLHGLVVNGDHVTAYGLMSEHHLQDLVVWNGEFGATYFFQSELPYDVKPEYGEAGFVGYRVSDWVQEHQAIGMGVYCFFRDYEVFVENAIHSGDGANISFTNMIITYLGGQQNSGIRHVINGQGRGVSGSFGIEHICAWP